MRMSQQLSECGKIFALILPVDLKYKGALLVLLWSTMMFSYGVLIGQYVNVIDSSTPANHDASYIYQYSTGQRQRQNETRLNAFGGQTQTRLRSPRPSNAGNSRALKA